MEEKSVKQQLKDLLLPVLIIAPCVSVLADIIFVKRGDDFWLVAAVLLMGWTFYALPLLLKSKAMRFFAYLLELFLGGAVLLRMTTHCVSEVDPVALHEWSVVAADAGAALIIGAVFAFTHAKYTFGKGEETPEKIE